MEPEDDDEGPPWFPLWAWITLAVGVAILFLICFYFNMTSGPKPLDGEENVKLKHSRFESKAFSDDGESYVPPEGGLGGLQSTPEPNRYLQSTVPVETASDSDDGDEGGDDAFVPPNISLDPNADSSMMNSPSNVIYEEDDEGDDDDDEGSGDDDEGEEENEEYGDYYVGEENDEDGSGIEDEEEGGTILGEFQVVDVEAQREDEGESESESESGEEGSEGESEYDEESFVEEGIEEEEEDMDYDEQSYEEEVLSGEDDEEDGQDGEQSWLDELQQAQAGNYPSWQNRSL